MSDNAPIPCPSAPRPLPPVKTRPGEGRTPFLAGVAGRMVDAAIGMLGGLVVVGFAGRQLGWTLETKVVALLAVAVALAVAGGALGLIAAARNGGRRR